MYIFSYLSGRESTVKSLAQVLSIVDYSLFFNFQKNSESSSAKVWLENEVALTDFSKKTRMLSENNKEPALSPENDTWQACMKDVLLAVL